jgi:hypothetical protein
LNGGQPYKGERLLQAAYEEFELSGAAFWVHGAPARDFDQVLEYLKGDVHDQSKVQIVIDGHFYGLDEYK